MAKSILAAMVFGIMISSLNKIQTSEMILNYISSFLLVISTAAWSIISVVLVLAIYRIIKQDRRSDGTHASTKCNA
ncbi:MAG: hypothetical protein CMB13_03295 [Euryarchaeota archaeon]|nr:hypothetical protein [Euryarchaeota archaeon]|tara:strand:- start:2667 stop:2894 length:228 start_codon:yes stop_codon:yes gene_type:complete